MGHTSFLRNPKEEEFEVPVSTLTEFVDTAYIDDTYNEIDEDMDGFASIFWSENDDDKISGSNHGSLSWDFMEWKGFHDQEEEDSNNKVVRKMEDIGFGGVESWHEDAKRQRLNLNLNYQQVLDAWSDRGPLLADELSLLIPNGGCYMGEVQVMEEEKNRREASVLRYKEKRQSRLFSKKIRYQVRKLNAEKRPRLKGRFVKRE